MPISFTSNTLPVGFTYFKMTYICRLQTTKKIFCRQQKYSRTLNQLTHSKNCLKKYSLKLRGAAETSFLHKGFVKTSAYCSAVPTSKKVFCPIRSLVVVPWFQERYRTGLWIFSVKHLMRCTVFGFATVAVRL